MNVIVEPFVVALNDVNPVTIILNPVESPCVVNPDAIVYVAVVVPVLVADEI